MQPVALVRQCTIDTHHPERRSVLQSFPHKGRDSRGCRQDAFNSKQEATASVPGVTTTHTQSTLCGTQPRQHQGATVHTQALCWKGCRMVAGRTHAGPMHSAPPARPPACANNEMRTRLCKTLMQGIRWQSHKQLPGCQHAHLAQLAATPLSACY
jgi:hypothetical protein